jgi:hypothetical protein
MIDRREPENMNMKGWVEELAPKVVLVNRWRKCAGEEEATAHRKKIDERPGVSVGHAIDLLDPHRQFEARHQQQDQDRHCLAILQSPCLE